jgi:peptidoglycan/xylan/chitin deacetylase (PgdA/CDA1 family)
LSAALSIATGHWGARPRCFKLNTGSQTLSAEHLTKRGEYFPMSSLILMYHRVTGAGGGAANLHCLSMQSFAAQIAHLSRSKIPVLSWRDLCATDRADEQLHIALTFDDGSDSDFECARLLRSKGLDALFFIATAYIGRPSFLSMEQIRALHALGMGVASHSHGHIQLASLIDDEVERELSLSKGILEEIINARVEHLSFPGGSYDSRILAIGRRVGYRYFFTSDWGLNTNQHFVNGVLRRTAVVNTVDLRQFEALLRHRHGSLRQITFHGKELAKRALGTTLYACLRRALTRLAR